MLKKTIIILFLFLSFAVNAFAGIKLKYGNKSFVDGPSDNITSIKYYGLGFDIGIPFVGVDFLADIQVGAENKGVETISITETSLGIRKEFLAIVKPFVGLGTSINKIAYIDQSGAKDTKSYNGTWFSAGLNFSAIIIQAGLEYRVDIGEKTSFDNSGGKVNLASNASSIYFGFGIGF